MGSCVYYDTMLSSSRSMKTMPLLNLKTEYPEIAEQWYQPKNGSLFPQDVAPASGISVWWKCPIGADHIWKARIGHRTRAHSGCPFCDGRRVSETNSLASVRPDIAGEWHTEKNFPLTPAEVTVGSTKTVWWQCGKVRDHVWRYPVGRRTGKSGSGCPFCSGRRLSGENSLQRRYPILAAQWHPTKNGSLSPSMVSGASGKRVWWKCDEGTDHEWEAPVYQRATSPGCPFCRGIRVSITNSLAKIHPEIAKQWHPTNNGDLRPEDVSSGSGKRIWWICTKCPDHIWQSSVYVRTGKAGGCPFCSHQRFSVTNSLAMLHPSIAAEWDYERNEGLTPSSILPSSSKAVWWVCSKNSVHRWRASIKKRIYDKSGCHFCGNQRVHETNSLANKFPDIAAEWHPTKNRNLKPSDVVFGSHRSVWWKCSAGPDHEWKATVAIRTGKMHCGCPFCANRKVSITNSLATKFPKIAVQWDWEKNSPKRPEQVNYRTKVKYWWKCDIAEDHRWRQSCQERTGLHKTGCPFCANRRLSSNNSLQSVAPNLANEWHPSRNGLLRPNEIIAYSKRRIWWQCANDPEHVWQTILAARIRQQSGCPWCSIAPRSKQEISLAWELRHFIEFDIEDHKVRARGRLWDVDIILRPLKIIIEYDGSYYHKEKQETDLAKSNALIASGWTVLRIREDPLQPLLSGDICVPARNPKAAADAALKKISGLAGVKLRGLESYLRRKTCIADRYARAYIRNLLQSAED
jgi:hypothetical protein